MAIKLAAIDLDGTLLRDDMSISVRSKEAVHAAMEQGIRVVIATGRMWHSAKLKVDVLGLGNVPVVCYTGAWIKMSETGETLLKEGLDPALAAEVLAEGRKRGWHMTSFAEDRIYMEKRDGTEEKYRRYRAVFPSFIGEDFYHPAEPVTRLVFSEPDREKRKEMRRILEERFGDRTDIVHPGDDFIDVHRKGVSKATAVSFLMRKWDILPEETAAFGNTENDVPLLRLAGASYAVANAEPEAKAAAKYICGSNEEDGVADILEGLVQQQCRSAKGNPAATDGLGGKRSR